MYRRRKTWHKTLPPLWFQKYIQNNQPMKKTQVCLWIEFSRKAYMKVETSSLRNLKIMPRNLNEMYFHMNSISILLFSGSVNYFPTYFFFIPPWPEPARTIGWHRMRGLRTVFSLATYSYGCIMYETKTKQTLWWSNSFNYSVKNYSKELIFKS